MQHFKDGVERLFRRLVGTWDFILHGGDLEGKSIHRRYVVRGLLYEPDDIAAFGYCSVDQAPFYIMFSPTTIREKDYLFFMGGKGTRGQTPVYTIYNFNQREGKWIRGVFNIHDVGTPRTVITGDFFAYCEEKSAQESHDERNDLPPPTSVTSPALEVQERHEGGESLSLAVEGEEAGEEESMSEEEEAAFEHRMQEDERDYYLGKYGVDIDALEYRYDEGRTMEYGDEGYDIDNEHDTSMDYGIGEDIFDEEE